MDDKDLGVACGATASGTYNKQAYALVCKKRKGHQPTDCHADDGFIWWESQLETKAAAAA